MMLQDELTPDEKRMLSIAYPEIDFAKANIKYIGDCSEIKFFTEYPNPYRRFSRCRINKFCVKNIGYLETIRIGQGFGKDVTWYFVVKDSYTRKAVKDD